MARTKITNSQLGFTSTVDANGWTLMYDVNGKRVWTKSGTVAGISLPAGLSFANGAITSMPVGLTGANLWSPSYTIVDSLILDGSSRHVISHTIFSNDTSTSIGYGLINTYTGGAWSGSLGYNYRIEEA